MSDQGKNKVAVRFVPCQNDEAAGREAALLVARTLRQKPHAAIVFPTGNTPLPMYRFLRRMPSSLWVHSRLFHLDEYVPPDDAPGSTQYESYRAYMRRELFRHVGGRHYEMADYIARPEDYDALLRADHGPDLVVLGIGGNGHIAFNEPGSARDAPTRMVDLAEETIRDNFGALGQQGYPTRAATLGMDTILQARRIVLLATGEAKRPLVERAFDPVPPPTPDYPASWLKTHPHVTVITDFPISESIQAVAMPEPERHEPLQTPDNTAPCVSDGDRS